MLFLENIYLNERHNLQFFNIVLDIISISTVRMLITH